MINLTLLLLNGIGKPGGKFHLTMDKKFDFDHINLKNDYMINELNQIRHIDGLIDARALHSQFESFDIPNYSDLKKLKPGDFVKLSRNGERFWVKISGYVGRRWHGAVVNNLICNIDLSFGDRIYFMRRHIYDFKIGDKT